MSDKNKSLVLAIIDFLDKSIQDGTVKQDDREGLEVAVQCIGEAFGVDRSDEKQREQLSIKPANLQIIFDVFMKTRAKVGTSASSTSKPTQPAVDKALAENHKKLGNQHMSSKQYDKAIDAYTQAIASDPSNAVYYSNRAAAYSSKNDHLSAVGDAEKAISVDPSFVKGYSRLGHAQYALGDYAAAASAYRRGLEKDPTNANLKSGLKNAEARIVPGDDDDDDGPPPLIPDVDSSADPAPGLGSMPDMLRGFGGGGPGGGMPGAGGTPDMANLMNNPRMAEMAQQMMADGGMARLMQNPSVLNMMNRMQSGGAMPSMEEIMADPALRDLATQFGAGGT